jgi:integrase
MKTIADYVEDYLELRRGLGFKLRANGYILRDFARYCGKHGASHITTSIALQWAVMPDNIKPQQRGVRLGMVRSLAQYLSAVEPRTEIPPKDLLPAKRFHPVLEFYRDDQVVALVKAAVTVCKTDQFQGLTCSTLFGLLAVTGMRVGEALALKCSDVDLDRGVLSLSVTKGDRKRLVPLHPTAIRELARYLNVRAEKYPISPAAGFFVTNRGTPLPYSTVHKWFMRLARSIGLRGTAPANGLRLHDLRHHFAMRTLLDWYQEDIDVTAHLPELSTYLGHCHVSDTYWYLSAVPDLLQLAARRWKSSEGGPL